MQNLRNNSFTRLALSLALALVLGAGMAFAHHSPGHSKGGGNGGGGDGGGGTDGGGSATLTASCDPCQAGEVVVFSGGGYDTSLGIVYLDFGGSLITVAMDADGSISLEWPYFTAAGTYTVEALQDGKGKGLDVKASTTVTVE